MTHKLKAALESEVKRMLEYGARQISIPAMKTELAAMGYRIDKDSRCAGTARNLTTGNTYPSITFGVNEVDTGMSAFHYQARRDANFTKLQAWRMVTFAVVRGYVVTI